MYPLIHFYPPLFKLSRKWAPVTGKIGTISAEVNTLFFKACANRTSRQTRCTPLPASYAIRFRQKIQYSFKLRISRKSRGVLGHTHCHVAKPLQSVLQHLRRLRQLSSLNRTHRPQSSPHGESCSNTSALFTACPLFRYWFNVFRGRIYTPS